MPKTLFGFYFRRGFRFAKWAFAGWLVAVFVSEIAYGVLVPLTEKWFLQVFEAGTPAGAALWAAGAAFAVMLLGDLADVADSWIRGRMFHQVKFRLSAELNDYAHSQSMGFFQATMAGKINSETAFVLGGLLVVEKVVHFFAMLATILLSVGMIARVDWRIGLLFAAGVVFRVVWSLLATRPMVRTAAEASRAASVLNGKLVDNIANFSIVKAFAGRASERKYLAGPFGDVLSATYRARYRQRWFWVAPAIFQTFVLGALMLLCARLFFAGEISVAEIAFAMLVRNVLVRRVSVIMAAVPEVVENLGAARQAWADLVRPVSVADGAADFVPGPGAIDIRGVSFRYKRRLVLRDFSLSVRPGERVGIVGASGEGKTTLMNLLLRFWDPEKGAIFIDGQNIREVKQDSLRAAIGFVPQDPGMFNRTLAENIAYGAAAAEPAKIVAAARAAGADGFIRAAEKGYDTLVGDRGIKLSGGQRQRIAIARAFLKDAPILVLDEATSALDSETERSVQANLRRLMRGRTTIAVAHRLSTIKDMDRIVVIERGRAAEIGTHRQLLKLGGIYAKLWALQN
ncbi:MAG: ABC transporter ATP-binding protein/permease [Rickettsiales bacterium]|jgi:ABC-type multidrug transport system fused ATPase/permease subunit|nr:ABC transporter ATP-binding protein/permease [Rickettsiales bacterium]